MRLNRQGGTAILPWREPVAKRSRAEIIGDIDALARTLEPALRIAVLAHVAIQENRATLAAILKALQAGDNALVLDLILGADSAPARQAVEDAARAALWAGAASAASQINLRLRGTTFAFDKLNPQLVQWVKSYAHNLIREIDKQTRESVRAALLDGMHKGQNPVATARDVRQAIGLTTKQAKAVANFRAQLETFHLRTSAKGWNLGGKIDRVNGRQVFRPDADGTPLDGIDERRLRDFRFDGTLRRAMETGKPLTPAQIDKMVEAYRRKFLRFRAETIARTEALRATNQGVQEAWRQAILDGKADAGLVRRQWVVAKDERLCPTCSPVPGMNPERGVLMDEPFKTPDGPVMLPPVHPNCLPAGALVSAGSGITAATQRWHEGDLAVIRTASGQELSATINHPVLTDRGWVGAGFLKKGDHVVRRLAPERLAPEGHDHENVPARIEDVARAFIESGEMPTAEVPVAAEHFHGDGFEGEVAVVASDRLLGHSHETARAEHRVEAPLVIAGEARETSLPGEGCPLPPLLGVTLSTTPSMGGTNLSGSLLGAHTGPLDGFGLGSPSGLDAGTKEAAPNDAAADAVLARDLVLGSTGPVALDEVVDVRRIPFAGHVFNLETTQGHYTANGLISHNCRCTIFLRQYEPSQLAGG